MRSWVKVVVLVAVIAALSAPAPVGADAAPARDITKFACPANGDSPFTDVPGNAHEVGIECLFLFGIVNGTGATTFSPGSNVTRGQLATIIARALALAGVTFDITDAGFTDLGGSVHTDAINALANLQVITGKTPTTFDPDGLATRAQTASIVARTLPEGLPANPPDAFTDDEGATAHEGAINALAAVGIISGVTPSQYAPDQSLNRGAAASLAARAFDFAVEIGLAGPPLGGDEVLAALSPANVSPGPGQAGAAGSVAVLGGNLPGLLCVHWDIDGPFTSAPTSAHVHAGAPGATGPVVLTLPTPQVAAGERLFSFGCVSGVSDAAIDAVLANPAGHYVDVETSGSPNGALRGQLTRFATPLGSVLTSSEVAPGPGEPDAGGDAPIDVLADGRTVCVSLFYDGADTPTSASIHKAAPGATAPAVITLPPFDPDGPVSDGCVGGLDPAVVSDLAANPAAYYVQINTNTRPNGAVRGQLALSRFLDAELDGPSEVPGPGDPDGTGFAFIDVLGDGRICAFVSAQRVDRVVAAHIHKAAPDAAGPIVVPLPAPIFGAVNECVDADPALIADLAANPEDYYVNVHTQAFPNGAIRGQLGFEAAPLAAGMRR